ncbi:acyl-CoA carboxylase subunit epsilon [Corynebacterium sp. HMSC29G08]|uniref:acyl-CoA carboxylase subunit epsilon n=1 Tax=Corynebacterium sp. HMSC29G08 TaxID=1581069 RepID=UPI0008C9EABD|nr:acyl-CoA carboxylase subunit epsilon [Corynebacterium sp. HMSC29G08]OFT82923.1 hypothetical protein HMPREF3101_06605 [Corynebacterium sp. HMSC29G08]
MMDIEVLKGNPTGDELAALVQVLEELKAKNSAAAPADANGWGTPAPRNYRGPLFNPHAFDSAVYF